MGEESLPLFFFGPPDLLVNDYSYYFSSSNHSSFDQNRKALNLDFKIKYDWPRCIKLFVAGIASPCRTIWANNIDAFNEYFLENF